MALFLLFVSNLVSLDRLMSTEKAQSSRHFHPRKFFHSISFLFNLYPEFHSLGYVCYIKAFSLYDTTYPFLFLPICFGHETIIYSRGRKEYRRFRSRWQQPTKVFFTAMTHNIYSTD